MKSRTQKALLGSFFTYGQFIVAICSTFFVTPLILRTLETRQYGLWLSSGELIGYLLLLDFGVFAILPWLVARADGQKQTDELKRLLVQTLTIAICLSATLLLVISVGWQSLPSFLRLSKSDWHGLSGPLALLIVLLLINLPLNLFTSLLSGLQDVRYCGVLGLIKALTGPLIIVGLLLSGYQLYALAVGAALFSPIGGIISFFRVRRIAPDLLKNWPRPTFAGSLALFREGFGAWLGGAGVQMIERSSGIVLTFLGNPAIVPTLVCTSRISQMLTQMAWVMPDSALIGFAQLGGENNPIRLREVALSIIRLHLVVAVGVACFTLAFNPALVKIWVGDEFFGGYLLNLLLATKVICGSLVHAFATIVAVQGNRLQIGMATLLQGAIYIGLALLLTRRFNLNGLLAADLLAPLLSTVPISLWLLRSTIGLGLRQLSGELASLLLLRAGPCLLLAAAYGYWRASQVRLPELAAVGALVAFIYLQLMASQLSTFPLPHKARIWLQRLRMF